MEAYTETRKNGCGTNMAAVVAAVSWFLRHPCQPIPKLGSDGSLLSDSDQALPYAKSTNLPADKILMFSKFPSNFGMIRSVCLNITYMTKQGINYFDQVLDLHGLKSFAISGQLNSAKRQHTIDEFSKLDCPT